MDKEQVYRVVFHFRNNKKITKEFYVSNDNKEELSINDKILTIVENAGIRGIWLSCKDYTNVKNYYPPSHIEKIMVIKGHEVLKCGSGYAQANFQEKEEI